MAGLSLRDRFRSSIIWEGLGVEALLLYIERIQLRWFGQEPGCLQHPALSPSSHIPGISYQEEAQRQT